MIKALLTVSLTITGLALPASSMAQAQQPAASALTATPTPEGGMRMGSASAPAALVEYVSYTCPHCATYDAQSHEELRDRYIARGMASVEVRPLVRDVVDLASAALARCGGPARFFERHHALMARQSTTIAAAQAASSGWPAVPRPQLLARVAADTGLIGAVAPLGVSTAEAEACLADTATIRQIAAVGEGAAALGVTGTPSFLLNGQLLSGVHSWMALRPRLDAPPAAR